MVPTSLAKRRVTGPGGTVRGRQSGRAGSEVGREIGDGAHDDGPHPVGQVG
jgi:hypothetical protein